MYVIIVRRLLLVNLGECVISKQAFLDSLSGHKDKSFSVLYAVHPFSLVIASISPIHLSESTSKVIEVISLVYVSSCPCEDAISVFLVLHIFSLVFIAVPSAFLPHAVAFS